MTTQIILHSKTAPEPFTSSGLKPSVKVVDERLTSTQAPVKVKNWGKLLNACENINKAFQDRSIDFYFNIEDLKNDLKTLEEEDPKCFDKFQITFCKFASIFCLKARDSDEVESYKKTVLCSLALKLPFMDYSDIDCLTSDLLIANKGNYTTLLHLKALQLHRMASEYVYGLPDIDSDGIAEEQADQLLADISQQKTPQVGIKGKITGRGSSQREEPLSAEQKEVNYLIAKSAPSLGLTFQNLQLPNTPIFREEALLDFKHYIQHSCTSEDMVDLAHKVQVAHFKNPVSELVQQSAWGQFVDWVAQSNNQNKRKELKSGSELLSSLVGRKNCYAGLKGAYHDRTEDALKHELTAAHRSAKELKTKREHIPEVTFRYKWSKYTLKNDGKYFWLQKGKDENKREAVTLRHVMSILEQLDKQLTPKQRERVVKQAIRTTPETEIATFIRFAGAAQIIDIQHDAKKELKEASSKTKKKKSFSEVVVGQLSCSPNIVQRSYLAELVRRFKTQKYADALVQYQAKQADKKMGQFARHLMTKVGVSQVSIREDAGRESHQQRLQEIVEVGGTHRLTDKAKPKLKASPDRKLAQSNSLAQMTGQTVVMKSLVIPLEEAIRKPDPAAVEKILNDSNVRQAITLNGGEFSVGSLVLKACELSKEHKDAQKRIIKSFLKHIGVSFTVTNDNGDNILHIACQNQQPELVKIIADKYPVLVKKLNKDGMTPLHVACMSGDAESACLLYKKYQCTSLVKQSKATNQELKAYPISSKELSAKAIAFHNELTPFQIACLNGHKGVVEGLLKINPDFYKQRSSINTTCLMLAIESGNVDLVEYLLEIYKTEFPSILSQSDATGRTPLILAVLNQEPSMISVLLGAGANPKTPLAVKEKQWSILELACLSKNEQVLDVLLSSNLVDHNQELNDGDYLIHKIVRISNPNAALAMLEVALRSGKVDLTRENKEGVTASFFAEQVKSPCADRLRLETVKQVETEGKQYLENVPLHNAIQRGDTTRVKQILEAKDHQVNVLSKSGKTALMMALELGHKDIVAALINVASIDISKRGADGRTALHYAASSGDTYCFTLLLKRSLQDWQQEQPQSRGHLSSLTERVLKIRNIGDCYDVYQTMLEYTSSQSENTAENESVDLLTATLEDCVESAVGETKKSFACPSLVELLSAVDDKGYSALHYAALVEGENATQLLDALYVTDGEKDFFSKDEYAQIFESKDNDGYTFVHRASQNPNIKVLKWCEEKGLLQEVTSQEIKSVEVKGEVFYLKKAYEDIDIPTTVNKPGSGLCIKGESFIHAATRANQADNVQFLQERMPLTAPLPNLDGVTPLQIARKNKFTKVVNVILSFIKSLFTSKTKHLSVIDRADFPMHRAVVNGINGKDFRSQLAENRDLLNSRNDNGDSLLHTAIEHGNFEVADSLIGNSDFDISAKNANGKTAFDLIRSQSSLWEQHNQAQSQLEVLESKLEEKDETIKYKFAHDILIRPEKYYRLLGHLIAKGEFDFTQSEVKRLILEYTSKGGHHVVQALMDYANSHKELGIDAKGLAHLENEHKDTLLHIAVKEGHHELVKILLNNNADINKRNGNKETVLHTALKAKNDVGEKQSINLPILKELLAASREFDTFSLTVTGKTAVHLAVESGNIEALTEVLNANKLCFERTDREDIDGFDCEIRIDVGIDRKDNDGQTAAHLAMSQGSNEVLKLLHTFGADLSIPFKEKVQDTSGHIILITRVEPTVAEPVKNLKIHNAGEREHLIKAGINATIRSAVAEPNFPRDNENNTALHFLYKKYRLAQTEQDKSLCLNQIDYLLSTPRYQNPSFINATDRDGNTALHLAIESGHIELVQKLINFKGIDFVRQNSKGQTVAHLIAASKDTGLVRLMLQSMPLAKNTEQADVPSILCIGDNDGNLPIHIACMHNNLQMFIATEYYQAELLRAPGKSECTPLMIAALNRHQGIFLSLLNHYEKHLDEFWKPWPDFKFEDVIPEEATESKSQLEALLISDEKTKTSDTTRLRDLKKQYGHLDFYLVAIALKDIDILRAVTNDLDSLRELTKQTYEGQNNLLHVAVTHQDTEAMAHLCKLQINGQATLTLDMFDESPENQRESVVFDDLQYAWESPWENQDLNDFLYIENGAPCFKMTDKNEAGLSALHIAVMDSKHPELSQFLIGQCKDKEPLVQKTTAKTPKSPQQLAQEHRVNTAVDAIVEKLAQIATGGFTEEQETAAQAKQVEHDNLESFEYVGVRDGNAISVSRAEAEAESLTTIKEEEEFAEISEADYTEALSRQSIPEEYDVIDGIPKELTQTVKVPDRTETDPTLMGMSSTVDVKHRTYEPGHSMISNVLNGESIKQPGIDPGPYLRTSLLAVETERDLETAPIDIKSKSPTEHLLHDGERSSALVPGFFGDQSVLNTGLVPLGAGMSRTSYPQLFINTQLELPSGNRNERAKSAEPRLETRSHDADEIAIASGRRSFQQTDVDNEAAIKRVEIDAHSNEMTLEKHQSESEVASVSLLRQEDVPTQQGSKFLFNPDKRIKPRKFAKQPKVQTGPPLAQLSILKRTESSDSVYSQNSMSHGQAPTMPDVEDDVSLVTALSRASSTENLIKTTDSDEVYSELEIRTYSLPQELSPLEKRLAVENVGVENVEINIRHWDSSDSLDSAISSDYEESEEDDELSHMEIDNKEPVSRLNNEQGSSLNYAQATTTTKTIYRGLIHQKETSIPHPRSSTFKPMKASREAVVRPVPQIAVS
ncbi:hypothetical protein SOPP22_04935 [Shewanella sp. OPT22]|nr:hypothetical protein SOPP22_04935 [Shewanella sp. OPT22]